MDCSDTKLPPNPRWNDLVFALTTVALLSVSFWANSASTRQVSHELQPTHSSPFYVDLLHKKIPNSHYSEKYFINI